MNKQILWAVDFGHEQVTAQVAEPKSGSFRLLARCQTPSAGLKHGEVVNAGDATECLVSVLRQAEKASGVKCVRLFYNFDDAHLESHCPSGSRALFGEGQIQRPDIEQAVLSARRLVGDFEKCVVYSRQTQFLIDGKDVVANPVGVFGRQLDVRLHVLLGRAQNRENWQKVMQRAGVQKSVGILSILSAVYGMLDHKERQGRHVVLDLGRDILNAALYEKGLISEYAGGPCENEEAALKWAETIRRKYVGEGVPENQIFLTGDLAEDNKDSSLKGLLFLAMEMPGKGPGVSRGTNELVFGLKQKASEWMREYF